ncbi:hypothetical protein [Dactylosporangium sp. CA-139066]|uniref:hypothetical protein n=1 Tax=Dactylosporangium sp. CA-139066 TaxID=3239930 RepID=UPI003D916C68
MPLWEYAMLSFQRQFFIDGSWHFHHGQLHRASANRYVWLLETSAGFEILGETTANQPLNRERREGQADPPRAEALSLVQVLDVIGGRGWIASPEASGNYFLRRERQ